MALFGKTYLSEEAFWGVYGIYREEGYYKRLREKYHAETLEGVWEKVSAVGRRVGYGQEGEDGEGRIEIIWLLVAWFVGLVVSAGVFVWVKEVFF